MANWTAKTWQAVRFVIDQRSRHPAYNTSPPRARSKSPHYSIPVQNTTSLHSLTTSSASNSSSCMGTPRDNADGLSAASAMMTPSSRENSFRKQPLHHNTASSSSASAATNHPSISGLSALFASHAAIGDAASSSGANVQATH